MLLLCRKSKEWKLPKALRMELVDSTILLIPWCEPEVSECVKQGSIETLMWVYNIGLQRLSNSEDKHVRC